MTPYEIESLVGLPPLSLTVSADAHGRQTYSPPLNREQQAKLDRALAKDANPPTNALEALEADGFLTSFGVRLGCGPGDQAQWLKLSTHLDLAQDALSKSSNKPWEQVRPQFEAQPINVQLFDGEVWATTVGQWRTAFLEMSSAYLAAWSASYQ